MTRHLSAAKAGQLSIEDFAADISDTGIKSVGDRPGQSVLVWSALGALCGALGSALIGDNFWLNLLLPLLLVSIFLIVQTMLLSGKLSKLLGAFFLILAFALTCQRQIELRQPDLDYLTGEHVTISGCLYSTDAERHTCLLTAPFLILPDGTNAKISSTVQVTLADGAVSELSSECGQIVSFRGILSRPESRGFSFSGVPAAYFASRGIYFTLEHAYVKQPGVKVCPATMEHGFCSMGAAVSSVINDLRVAVLHFFEKHMDPALAQLIASMVMGDRAVALSPALKLSFNKVGLSHLLAASGMNLTIILGFVLALSTRLQKAQRVGSMVDGQSKNLEVIFCVIAVVSFSLLAGTSPSVFRAMVMCLLALFARCIYRQISAISALCLALMLSIWLNPVSVFDIGLQLSYAATFGVLGLYPTIKASFDSLFARPGKACGVIISLAGIVLAAQCAVVPLQLYYFGQFSTVFLLANALAEPLVAPITVLGFIATLLVSPLALLELCQSHIPGLTPVVGTLGASFKLLYHPAGWITTLTLPLLWLLKFIVDLLASLPLSTIVTARPGLGYVIVFYVFLLLIVWQSKVESQSVFIARHFSSARLGWYVLCGSALMVFCCYLFAPVLEIFSYRDCFCLRRGGSLMAVFAPQRLPDKADTTRVNTSYPAPLAAFIRSRPETVTRLSTGDTRDHRFDCRVSPGGDSVLLLLKKDNLLVHATRSRGSVWSVAISRSVNGSASNSLACYTQKMPDFIASGTASRGGRYGGTLVTLSGALALARCLPACDLALPFYPVLSCHIEEGPKSYLLSFAL